MRDVPTIHDALHARKSGHACTCSSSPAMPTPCQQSYFRQIVWSSTISRVRLNFGSTGTSVMKRFKAHAAQTLATPNFESTMALCIFPSSMHKSYAHLSSPIHGTVRIRSQPRTKARLDFNDSLTDWDAIEESGI